MRFATFPFHLSKVLRLPRKNDARSYEVLHLSRKIISANLKIWCSKMQPLSGNQRPDHLTALMNMSLVLRRPRKMHLCRSSSNAPGLPTFLEMPQKTSRFAHFGQGAQSLAHATRNDIWPSKSAPYPAVFCTFDFEMFFVPQRRALSRHQNFYKCSEVEVFCTFLTWKCASRHNRVHFFDISTFKHILNPSFFTPLTSKCASRHNGVQFFISHLASWLRTRRFSEPTFRPSGGTNHWKNAMFRDFPTFSRTWMFFDLLSSSLLFSSLTLPISAFHLSILSEVSLLNFLRQFLSLHYLFFLFLLLCAFVPFSVSSSKIDKAPQPRAWNRFETALKPQTALYITSWTVFNWNQIPLSLRPHRCGSNYGYLFFVHRTSTAYSNLTWLGNE